jgi:hypothetical protein
MKNRKSQIHSILVLLSLLSANWSQAKESGFDYPELSVVPLASERLLQQKEADRVDGLKTHANILFPASMTFLAGAGLLANGPRDGSDNGLNRAAPYIGMGVGALWWVATTVWIHPMDEYGKGAAEISKISVKSTRDLLTRERTAEESIRKAAKISRRMKWLSVLSNLAASALMGSAGKEDGYSNALAGISAITSLTPLIFKHRWEDTECLQEEYKRRIYAPVAGPALITDPSGLSLSPGVALSLRF